MSITPQQGRSVEETQTRGHVDTEEETTHWVWSSRKMYKLRFEHLAKGLIHRRCSICAERKSGSESLK